METNADAAEERAPIICVTGLKFPVSYPHLTGFVWPRQFFLDSYDVNRMTVSYFSVLRPLKLQCQWELMALPIHHHNHPSNHFF